MLGDQLIYLPPSVKPADYHLNWVAALIPGDDIRRTRVHEFPGRLRQWRNTGTRDREYPIGSPGTDRSDRREQSSGDFREVDKRWAARLRGRISARSHADRS